MNLWFIFPESLLSIKGILLLPYFALPFYLYVIYPLIKQPEQRTRLVVFIILTLITSFTLFFSMGPAMGRVIPPLLLLVVMIYPVLILIHQVIKKNAVGILTWSMASIAGWLHSLSWLVWFFALAGS